MTRKLSSAMPILVMCPETGGVRNVGFIVDELPLPERLQKVYFTPIIAPRPSHEQECPVCMGLTTGLAFDFPCTHMICWGCAKSWAAQARSMTCPMCRNDSLSKGNYYGTSTQLELVVIDGITCAFAYTEPVPHISLPYALIEIVTDVSTGWWATLYASEQARFPVRMILQEAAGMPVVAQMIAAVKRKCAWCGTGCSQFRCTRCKTVHYCSQTCQKLHWKLHKRTCAVV
jgi:hypothetical protein